MVMGEIIAVHSFRGGTGKSNITANLAYAIAKKGNRVGVIDTDVQSPGIHTLFGLTKDQIIYTLNDYLLARAALQSVAYDMSEKLKLETGKLFLVPASMDITQISYILKEGYNVTLLNAGLRDMLTQLNLDYLLVDTHPGINEETLLSISLANHTVVVLRADQQDYQGTSITVAVARKLGAHPGLVINMLPAIFDEADVVQTAEEAYKAEVWAVIPHSQDVLSNGSAGLVYADMPDHAFSQKIDQIYQHIQQRKSVGVAN
jgi:MinD-like ATPase involved in chromosome partitioning or flagellar assembly